ncbi:hypothetical protein GCM10023075_73010 [Streptosporangium album]
MEPEFHRRHGSVYDASAKGRIDPSGLRRLPLGVSSAARVGEPPMFAIDVTPQARPGPGKPLSPYRVRLGFRRLRAKLGTPASK